MKKLFLLLFLITNLAFGQSFTKGIPQKLDFTSSPKFKGIVLDSVNTEPLSSSNTIKLFTNSSNVLSQKDENGRITEMNGIEIASTFATISASTKKRIVLVTADETNGGVATIYFYTGTNLKWIVTTDL